MRYTFFVNSFAVLCKTTGSVRKREFFFSYFKQRRKLGEREARVAREESSTKKLTPVRVLLFKLFRPQTHPK